MPQSGRTRRYSIIHQSKPLSGRAPAQELPRGPMLLRASPARGSATRRSASGSPPSPAPTLSAISRARSVPMSRCAHRPVAPNRRTNERGKLIGGLRARAATAAEANNDDG